MDEGPISPELRLRMHDPRVIDARGRMLDLSGMGEAEIAGSVEIMDAMFRWKRAEQWVSDASSRYMRLSQADMRAVRFIIVRTDQGELVSARDIADHMGISSASTTKLLDRLESGGHIERRAHPEDRRALAIVVTDSTRTAAERTVGREHARRFRVAASLSAQERAAVLKFLDALSEVEWPEPDGAAGPE